MCEQRPLFSIYKTSVKTFFKLFTVGLHKELEMKAAETGYCCSDPDVVEPVTRASADIRDLYKVPLLVKLLQCDCALCSSIIINW